MIILDKTEILKNKVVNNEDTKITMSKELLDLLLSSSELEVISRLKSTVFIEDYITKK